MEWSQDALWAKAKIYMARAMATPHESTEFGLWSTIALEFLGRSVLASVHPSLLADSGSKNILYACNVGNIERPKSIDAKTVFDRCINVIEGFTEDDSKFVMSLMNLRNAEVHSGGTPFENQGATHRLHDYYRTSAKLLEFLKKTMPDYVGDAEAEVATTLMKEAARNLIEKINKRIAAHKTIYDDLGLEEKERRRKDNEQLRETWGRKIVRCPSCSSTVEILGKQVRASERRIKGELIIQNHTFLPVELKCETCGLHFDTNEELQVARLGGVYSRDSEHEPLDVYHEDFIAELESGCYD